MKRIVLSLVIALSLVPVGASARERLWEDYFQYANIAVDLLLRPLGVGDTPYGEVALSCATSTAMTLVSGYSLKWTINEKRPGGGNYSFPSNHTAGAFMGAELIRIHYGWGWAIPAYGLAAAVGTARVVHEWHWWWDVVAGAVLGIGCAHAGWKVTGLILAPTVDPLSGGLCCSLVYRF